MDRANARGFSEDRERLGSYRYIIEYITSWSIPSPKLKWNECGFCSTVGAIKHTTENPQKPWLLFYHSCSASSLR